jgi:hypothetical protein
MGKALNISSIPGVNVSRGSIAGLSEQTWSGEGDAKGKKFSSDTEHLGYKLRLSPGIALGYSPYSPPAAKHRRMLSRKKRIHCAERIEAARLCLRCSVCNQ